MTGQLYFDDPVHLDFYAEVLESFHCRATYPGWEVEQLQSYGSGAGLF